MSKDGKGVNGMSSDANGILFFGFDLGDEGLPWEDWDRWLDGGVEVDDYIAFKLGAKIPKNEYSSDTSAEYYKYWDKKKKVLMESGCKVCIHRGYAYPMYYVCLSDKNLSAYSECPREVNSDFLAVNEYLVHRLKKFCETVGIEWKEPRWYLTSFYG